MFAGHWSSYFVYLILPYQRIIRFEEGRLETVEKFCNICFLLFSSIFTYFRAPFMVDSKNIGYSWGGNSQITHDFLLVLLGGTITKQRLWILLSLHLFQTIILPPTFRRRRFSLFLQERFPCYSWFAISSLAHFIKPSDPHVSSILPPDCLDSRILLRVHRSCFCCMPKCRLQNPLKNEYFVLLWNHTVPKDRQSSLVAFLESFTLPLILKSEIPSLLDQRGAKAFEIAEMLVL